MKNTLKSTKADMFQSVVDALAFEARLNLETLESLGVHVTELRGVGGGTRSRRILELKATVLNRPICTLKNPEAALLGVAMLAQLATRQFSDLKEAQRECVVIDQTIEPAETGTSAYEAAFERFRQVYATLKSLYHNWRTACPNTPAVSNE